MKTINSPVRIYNAMYSFNYASRILRMFCVPRLILVYKKYSFLRISCLHSRHTCTCTQKT